MRARQGRHDWRLFDPFWTNLQMHSSHAGSAARWPRHAKSAETATSQRYPTGDEAEQAAPMEA
jgi:hypothetical protein